MVKIMNPKGEKSKEGFLNTEELIGILGIFLKDKKFPKRKPYPRFTFKEVDFIVDLIFYKPNQIIFIYLADYFLSLEGDAFKEIPFSGRTLKKIEFLRHLLMNYNAAKSARLSGYSHRCAKQQGYRLIKEIQGHYRTGTPIIPSVKIVYR